MAKSKTAQYYAKNPEARKKRLEYQKKYNARPSEVKRRVELKKYNRDKGTDGNGDGKDASHKGGRIVGFEDASRNRGRREKSRVKGYKRKKR